MTNKKESKMCMVYLKNVKTNSFETVKGKKVKLSQTEIDKMHEEIKSIYPKQGLWISRVEKHNCNCKK